MISERSLLECCSFCYFSPGHFIPFQFSMASAALTVTTAGMPTGSTRCHFRGKACLFCTGIREKCSHIWGIQLVLIGTFSKIFKILFSRVFFPQYICNMRWPTTKKLNRQISNWILQDIQGLYITLRKWNNECPLKIISKDQRKGIIPVWTKDLQNECWL